MLLRRLQALSNEHTEKGNSWRWNIRDPWTRQQEEIQARSQQAWRHEIEMARRQPHTLFNGDIWVNENVAGKICILCGSPDHVFADCHADDQLRQQITTAFDHVKQAIEAHSKTLAFPGTSPVPRPLRGERASGSNDQMDVEGVASSEEDQRLRRVQGEGKSVILVVFSSHDMRLERTCLRSCIAEEGTTTMSVVRTFRRWVSVIMMQFSIAFRRAHRQGTLRYLNG